MRSCCRFCLLNPGRSHDVREKWGWFTENQTKQQRSFSDAKWWFFSMCMKWSSKTTFESKDVCAHRPVQFIYEAETASSIGSLQCLRFKTWHSKTAKFWMCEKNHPVHVCSTKSSVHWPDNGIWTITNILFHIFTVSLDACGINEQFQISAGEFLTDRLSCSFIGSVLYIRMSAVFSKSQPEPSLRTLVSLEPEPNKPPLVNVSRRLQVFLWPCSTWRVWT